MTATIDWQMPFEISFSEGPFDPRKKFSLDNKGICIFPWQGVTSSFSRDFLDNAEETFAPADSRLIYRGDLSSKCGDDDVAIHAGGPDRMEISLREFYEIHRDGTDYESYLNKEPVFFNTFIVRNTKNEQRVVLSSWVDDYDDSSYSGWVFRTTSFPRKIQLKKGTTFFLPHQTLKD